MQVAAASRAGMQANTTLHNIKPSVPPCAPCGTLRFNDASIRFGNESGETPVPLFDAM